MDHDHTVMTQHILTLLFPSDCFLLHKQVAKLFLHGLLYSKVNEEEARLFLMWVLQLSKKN